MTQYETDPSDERVSGWAVAGLSFAAVMMLLIGTFHVIAGLAAIIEDELFVVGRNYAFDIDVTGWGWIHLLLGLVVVAAGIGLFARQAWAGVTAVVLALLSAIANFFWIPYYPWWSLLIIALDVWVIWSLTRRGAIRA